MSAKEYRKKPIVVEAIQWKGDNYDDVVDFATRAADGFGANAIVELFIEPDSDLAEEQLGALHARRLREQGSTGAIFVDANCEWLGIDTGEWIIRDHNGFYPCKNKTFIETYEQVRP
ncbi:hypothetical protein [Rhodococcoides fascians]|uniref:hypothetical protein n=1 Tax=Rhodococcoides fascians TaxID=1828 RepID=UPI00050BEE7B|nr:hypothetical protein [Rhodococcus fascians]